MIEAETFDDPDVGAFKSAVPHVAKFATSIKRLETFQNFFWVKADVFWYFEIKHPSKAATVAPNAGTTYVALKFACEYRI